jgi:hypothetical protein
VDFAAALIDDKPFKIPRSGTAFSSCVEEEEEEGLL